jgi:hypothetical protein
MRKYLILPILAVLLASCDDAQVFEPQTASLNGVHADQPIVVMSRNLYLGADLDALLDPSANLPAALAAALNQVLYTDFAARAKELAQEIHDVQPHLVGLQEVTRYVIFDAGGNPIPFPGFPIDFLLVLQAELAALGDNYSLAWKQDHVSLVFPLDAILGFPSFVSYDDADAILARADVPTWNETGGHFPTQQELAVGGFAFENLRGWAQVDASINGTELRFATTHLEIQMFSDVQEAQASELVDILSDSPLPVVLVGDFNSAANHDAPEESQTGSYKAIRRAGYKDLWLREPHSVGGATCCQLADLSNTTSLLNQRLDIVFVRWGKAGFGGQSQVTLVGNETSDIFTHPFGYTLWPSDHAGIAAWMWPAPGRLASK